MKVAVVGSGPSAFYTIKYFLKKCGVAFKPKIDIFERLNEPFGLVRFGVAPDHPEVKNVRNDFKDLLSSNSSSLKLHCGINVADYGGDVSLKELGSSYDAVLLATGAQSAKLLEAPGLNPNKNHLPARSFVLWYNGHQDFQHLMLPSRPKSVAVFGLGNVALDVARILSIRPDSLGPLRAEGLSEYAYDWLCERNASQDSPTCVHIIGRSCYSQAAFTNKEFRELLHIPGCTAVVDPEDLMAIDDLKRNVANDRAKSRGLEVLEEMVQNYVRLGVKSVSHDPPKRIIQIHFNTVTDGFKNGILETRKFLRAKKSIPADLMLSSVGFKVESISKGTTVGQSGGLNHDGKGRLIHSDFLNGRFYVSGWAKRGPKGTIAANIPDALETATAMAEDLLRSSQ